MAWWIGDERERYWLELTDRSDLGADLRAPLTDARGQDNWRYTLFRGAKIGDVVLHYDSARGAVTSWSVIASAPEPASIVWAARGSYARDRNARPTEVPGYRIELSGFQYFDEPLTLDAIRLAKSQLQDLVQGEEARGRRPLYFPFELSARPVRPSQGYAFKLPSAFFEVFPQLNAAALFKSASLAPAPTSRVEQERRNVPWSRDELIVALDLYMSCSGVIPGKNSPEIRELSQTLNELARALGTERTIGFRNTNGVYMKLMNFRRFDPAYIKKGRTGLVRGNKDEEPVWMEFSSDPQRLHQVAAAIRAGISSSESFGPAEDGDAEAEDAPEGRVLTVLHRRRERSRKIVESKKARTLKEGGTLSCEVCEFNYAKAYGARGDGFIEVHHVKPLHLMKPGDVTRLEDLALLCANCHRMVHAARPWLELHELKLLMKR